MYSARRWAWYCESNFWLHLYETAVHHAGVRTHTHGWDVWSWLNWCCVGQQARAGGAQIKYAFVLFTRLLRLLAESTRRHDVFTTIGRSGQTDHGKKYHHSTCLLPPSNATQHHPILPPFLKDSGWNRNCYCLCYQRSSPGLLQLRYRSFAGGNFCTAHRMDDEDTLGLGLSLC